MKHELLSIIYRVTKKMKRNCRKLITSLKKMEGEFGIDPFLNEDHELTSLITVLREIIVTSIFRSFLSFFALSASESKSTKWLRMAKLMHKKISISF